ncbi:MAG: orotidine-5'-phosphate decarboxylase [Treponema sp.]|nr:orotidine-5'-phosphate decarboxylase [Treponema sp.]
MIAIDRLYESVKSKGHVCIGLDTSADYVPQLERKKAGNDALAVLAFNKALIDATYDVAACYKVQIAYYEEMGLEGLNTYSQTLKYIREKGAIVIADIKRGDIADTAIRYAKAHFSGDFQSDLVTLSPYMGMDSVEPWLKEAQLNGKGAFVLMRTSNKGMKDFQYLETTQTGKKVYNVLGDKMTELANQYKGECGYGMFGVVVGCTERDEAARIRQSYPALFFLIPGYGAQGGAAQDAVLLLNNGNGGVVNASRSIITAWQQNENKESADNLFAAKAAREAAIKMRDEILVLLKSGEKL